jgi:hypothetical protein
VPNGFSNDYFEYEAPNTEVAAQPEELAKAAAVFVRG